MNITITNFDVTKGPSGQTTKFYKLYVDGDYIDTYQTKKEAEETGRMVVYFREMADS